MEHRWTVEPECDKSDIIWAVVVASGTSWMGRGSLERKSGCSNFSSRDAENGTVPLAGVARLHASDLLLHVRYGHCNNKLCTRFYMPCTSCSRALLSAVSQDVQGWLDMRTDLRKGLG